VARTPPGATIVAMAESTVRWLRGALVGRRRVLEDRLIRLDGERIGWIGSPADHPSGARAAERVDGLLAPALLDVHCHGGGGNDVHGPGVDALTSGGPEVIAATVEALHGFAAFQSSRGVTAVLPTAVSLPLPALRTWLLAVAEVRRQQHEAATARRAAAATGRRLGWSAWPEAVILGANLEGPALADTRRGAHDPRALIAPATLLEFIETEPGLFDPVRIVTVAPEGAGGMALVTALAGRGIVASLGHTAADTATIEAAVGAGARSTTHLFNAMPPLHHRDPGLPGVALAGPDLSVELIADGIHVHPMLFAALERAVGDRLLLVSDAIAVAGYLSEGELELGGLKVTVRGPEARLADGTLAGSVTPLDAAMVRAIAAGIPIPAAIRAASTAPARLIAARDRGALRRGMQADLVVLDETGRVRATYLDGERLDA
jgi:N-acetylglucosamine-6-phosphate deacetylase